MGKLVLGPSRAEVLSSGPSCHIGHVILKLAKSNNFSSWGSYDRAVARYKNGDADGIGFMLLDALYLRRRSGSLLQTRCE